MKPDKGNNRKNTFGLISLILWALVLTLLFRSCTSSYNSSNQVQVDYSTFRQWVVADLVESVKIENSLFTITLKEGKEEEALSYIPEDGGHQQAYDMFSWMPIQNERETEYVTTPPPISDLELESLLSEHNVRHWTPAVDNSSQILYLLITTVLPIVIMVGAMVFLMRGIGGKGGMGGIGGVGKANAKVYVEKKTGVTFRDVAGQDEAKESLEEIIDILHNPQKYTEIGAKLPKGALLVGPPGTGKTLLAKAVAGEAGVPFFSISGSDFVEMFVGVGASRVRDLFKEASKMAPCIIFIDEIDTIGKSRDNRMGGNDEREQTLNQLLAELDGFDPGKGVIVLGATNRPEVLDKALLRPGRFDRRITIDRPNLAGRLSTLQVHTRKIKLAEDVDLKKIALATAGTVGADLANLVNEAALRAVRQGRRAVNQEDLLASFEFVIAGSEKKNSVLTEFERKLVAYHEVGHAMVAYKQKNAEPVQKITIVPHTEGSLGYTLLMPEEDKTNLRTREELMAKIAVSMGGRAAEEVVMDTMTNGASQDIQEATNIARNMVAMYGMSEEFGMMALGSVRNQYLEGGYGLDCAQDTAAVMDKAVKAILDVCYKDAVEVIRANREDMDKVVAYLLEKETITGGEMVAIIEGRDPATVEDAYASTKSAGKKPLPGDIEPPAKSIHMVSEEIKPPVDLEQMPVTDPRKPEGETPPQPEVLPAAEGETPPQPEALPAADGDDPPRPEGLSKEENDPQ
ncbi:ATP-dependent zinc metalloprotease FtsH [Pseudoflavonifractor sp. 60]|uniref:ATP-dependent zinc metalloprotease FtsH n=1 Tax=Pseudoflavonifractor sp. 60 TaxID=2304576 RepID=UPI001FAD48BD|nr:ATP-dependent zinc metalloprotease FtsH [Pseudoflavonifractor sp. 60]